MKSDISIITLGVRDLDASTDFYEQIGFPVARNGEITFIKNSGTWLALFPLDQIAKEVNIQLPTEIHPTFTLAHNVISKEQVIRVMDDLKTLGATIIVKPKEQAWGGFSGYFQDLDGYLWEVAYNPFDPDIAVDESC